MRQLLITITLVLAISFSGLAQTTTSPDFSATWVLSTKKSTFAKDNTIKSETIAVAYKKSAIVFEYKTDGKKSKETYTPDGQERVARDMASGQLISKASWHDLGCAHIPRTPFHKAYPVWVRDNFRIVRNP